MEIVVAIIVLAALAYFFLKKKPATETSRGQSTDGQPPADKSAKAEVQIPKTTEPQAERQAAASPAESQHTPEASAAPAAPDAAAASSAQAGEERATDDVARQDPASEEVSPPPPPARTGAGSTPKPVSVGRPAELKSLRKGLSKSRQSDGFFGRLKSLFVAKREIDPEIAEKIEEILLTSDVGVSTTEAILNRIKGSLKSGDLANEAQVWDALRDEARRALSVDGRSGGIRLTHKPTVVLFVGVNGAGKTTTIGKLAQQFLKGDKKVMLCAGDTFRAAAVDQLKAWGDRVGCEVISGKENADPSSVLFDAIQAAKDRGVDVLLADTAGRLHTNTNLMQEMSKIAKTAAKALDGAPHEVLLVIDSTNGQNAMAQARQFKEVLNISGLVLTKLDGTARGGAVLGICDGLQVPVRYVGVGERTEDLYEFDTNAFVDALLGADDEEIPVRV